jgi:hypothetical protein
MTMLRSAASTGTASASRAAREPLPDTHLARGGCLIELLTSNGIPAAASFLVGTAPSKLEFTRKPHFRFAPDRFGQMRPKRCHDRFGAMRIAPAIGPFPIKIVRMVGGTAHLSASLSLILSLEPEGQPHQCRRRVQRAIQFCGVRQSAIAQLVGQSTPRPATEFALLPRGRHICSRRG